METLKPCPFCGSEKVKVMLKNDGALRRCWFVQCRNCFSKGATVVESMKRQKPDEVYEQIIDATNEAKDAWNRRDGGEPDGQ